MNDTVDGMNIFVVFAPVFKPYPAIVSCYDRSSNYTSCGFDIDGWRRLPLSRDGDGLRAREISRNIHALSTIMSFGLSGMTLVR